MLIHGIHVNNEAVPHTGTITEINDTYFYVQITARMGVLKLPLRCLISEHRHIMILQININLMMP